MSVVGIYFGPKVISLVNTDGKKLVGNVNIPLNSLSDPNHLEEKVPEQLKMAILIKEELRKNAIDAKSADIVLPGKDLIIRTFHMPLLSSAELFNAVRFEAKKYIPFKVEDLVSDFQVKMDSSVRKNFVLFVGIKKENLDKYVSVMNQLNFKINSVEYAGFSILRLLKTASIKEKGIVAVVNVDLTEDDEVNFVVLEDGFPLFSRDITLTAESSQDVMNAAKPALSDNIEKLKIELRISLDFYLRKFPTKNIQNVIFIAPDEHRNELESFIRERGLAAKFVESRKILERSVPFSSSFLKAYAGSISKTIKSQLSIDLLPSKAKKKGSGGMGGFSSLPLLSNIKLDFKAILLGACIIGLPYLTHYYQKKPLDQQLEVTRGNRPKVTVVDAEAGYEDLKAIDGQYKEKIKTIKALLKDRVFLTSPLDTMPRIVPKGLWLTGMTFRREGNAMVLYLSGSVYLGESSQEMEAVNKFVSDLRNDPQFLRNFSNISVSSLDQGKFEDTILTNFRIICRSQ